MILVSKTSGGLARRKFVPAGAAVIDTIHLAPGSYHVTVNRPEHPARPAQDFSAVTIEQCKETSIAVTAF